MIIKIGESNVALFTEVAIVVELNDGRDDIKVRVSMIIMEMKDFGSWIPLEDQVPEVVPDFDLIPIAQSFLNFLCFRDATRLIRKTSFCH